MTREKVLALLTRPLVVAGLLVAVGGLGYWLGAAEADSARWAAESAAESAADECESRTGDLEYQLSGLEDRVRKLERGN